MQYVEITSVEDLDKLPWTGERDADQPLTNHVDRFIIDDTKPYSLRKAVADRLVVITDPGNEHKPMSDEVFAHYLGATMEYLESVDGQTPTPRLHIDERGCPRPAESTRRPRPKRR